jgi:hypothetical protein
VLLIINLERVKKMIGIGNSLEMAEYLDDGSDEAVQFPANSNILLDYDNFDSATKEQLEKIGDAAGRSVHLPGFAAAS